MKTYALLLGASALALMWSDAGWAQTKDKDSQQLETVVVTGERRHEDLKTTGISATVLSGTDIEKKNIVTIDQLQFSAPATVINDFGQGIDFNIRGIGKGEHNTQTLTGVITYRDGVATFPGYFTEEPYYDIAGVEVYRGPQGTFVGQNATGGAVFVRSNDPEIGGSYDGYVLAQYGNYYDSHLQGAVNIPVSDTFAMRVAFFGDARSSFFSIRDADPADNCPGEKYAGCKPGYNPGDVRWAAGRISMLWKPSDRFTLSFKYDADYLDSGAYPMANYTEAWQKWPQATDPNALIYKNYSPYLTYFVNGTNPNPNIWQYSASGTSATNPYYSSDPFHISANSPQFALDRFTRAVLTMSYEFANGITLKSVSGFQNGNTNWGSDLDGSDYGSPTSIMQDSYGTNNGNIKKWWFGDHVDETIWSQELNLISPDTDRLTWILGLFAQSDIYDFPQNKFTVDLDPASTNAATKSILWGQNPELSYAVFGKVSYKLFPSLEASFGGRYSWNRTTNDVTWNQYGNITTQTGATGFTEKSENFSYKASLEWSVNDTNFLYGFVATGYKPGGLNPAIYYATYQPAPFGPETVTSYEGGWKTQMFDGHVRAAIDAYYNEYDGFIVTVGYPNLTYPGFATEVNSPSATISSGLEAEIEAVFGDLKFNIGVGAMHQSLGKFYAVDARAVTTYTAGTCDPATGPSGGMLSTVCVNLQKHSMTYAPLLTGNVGIEYDFHLSDGDVITPRLSYAHQSPQWASLFANPLFADRIEARDLFNGQLDWKHDTYVFTLYSTNMTDQRYTAAIISPLRMPGMPRQYGIRLMKVF